MYRDENYAALAIAIFREVPPELAFELLENPSIKSNITITDEDCADMFKFQKKYKMTLKDIGEMYGLSKDAVFKRIKYYKERESV